MGLKLKFRKFWGLIPTFVEVTGETGRGGLFTPPPDTLNRVKGENNVADWITRSRKPTVIGIYTQWQSGSKFLQMTEGEWPIQTNCTLCKLP